ncbi:MAG: hemerythrin domain-containing protein [Zoogloea sp.]|nr:hemerythrin domain-containing protein [Zoogloea sp.]MCA0185731.1 hemerythrin domain-containing protein [Pseudomonadota bacterium]
MEALRIMIDEHQSLAAILHAIRLMLRDIGSGTLQPDMGLLRAMVHYLDAYPEKRHHPKEDQFIFALLKQRTAEGAEAVARLEEEHTHGNDRIKALEVAVQNYADGAPGGFQGFVDAFEAFAAFYRDHMMREEREILPLVHKHFTAEDWAVANAGFAGSVDPMSGTRTPSEPEDFAKIFSRLVAAAPEPIGLGAGPYKEG